MAVAALGLIAIITVIGLILLAALSEGVPDALVAIGSAAAGALAGIVTNAAAPAFRRPVAPTQYEIRPTTYASTPPTARPDDPTEPVPTYDPNPLAH